MAQWEPDVRLTYDDSLSLVSLNNARCIAAGPTGVIHVVWYDERDGGPGAEEVYYKRSTDCGSTWSADLRLTNCDGFRSWRPSICVSGSKVHIVWNDDRDNQLRVFYTNSPDEGLTWSMAVPIGSGFTWPPSKAAIGSYVHVVWDKTLDNAIWHNRSTDGGASWSGAIRLTTPQAADADIHASVSVSGSDVHLTWIRYNTTYGYNVCHKHSSDQGVTWTQDTCLLVWQSSQPQCPTHAVSDSVVHVVWLDGIPSGQIYYKRSTDRGTTWLQGEALSDSIYRTNFPSVTASGLNVHVAWEGTPYEETGSNIYYAFSPDAGSNWSTQSILTTDTITGAGLYPSIAVGDSMVHIAWQDGRHGYPYTGNREIYYKRNPTGNPYTGASENAAGKPREAVVRLTVVPNPFVTFTAIPNHDKDRFAVYDVSGRQVGIFYGDRVGSGLPPGVYFIRDENKGERPGRIVKVK